MTALNIATDIPSNIVTIEQLSVWASRCLWQLNSGTNALEGENYSQRAAQSGEFYIAANNKTRHIGRQSIEIAPEYQTGALKNWMYAVEIGTNPLLPAMKAN